MGVLLLETSGEKKVVVGVPYYSALLKQRLSHWEIVLQ